MGAVLISRSQPKILRKIQKKIAEIYLRYLPLFACMLEHCNKNKTKYNIRSKCLALQSFNFPCFLHKLKFAEISFYRERTFCSVLEMGSLQVYRFFRFCDHKYFSLSPWKTVFNQLVRDALVFAIHFSDFYQKNKEM